MELCTGIMDIWQSSEGEPHFHEQKSKVICDIAHYNTRNNITWDATNGNTTQTGGSVHSMQDLILTVILYKQVQRAYIHHDAYSNFLQYNIYNVYSIKIRHQDGEKVSMLKLSCMIV